MLNDFDSQQFLYDFKKGEESAFDQLFRNYFAALTYFANSIIHEPEEAEDIVQDCFVSLWKRRKKLDHIESIKSYLYTSIRYKCIKFLRKNRKLSTENLMLTEDAAIDRQIIAAETARELFRLIENLAPGMQEVIRLYYLEGKSYSEIAELLGIDVSSVRKSKYRGLAALRKTIISLS